MNIKEHTIPLLPDYGIERKFLGEVLEALEEMDAVLFDALYETDRTRWKRMFSGLMKAKGNVRNRIEEIARQAQSRMN